ncbi:hypothetical protein AVEN_143439-1, partial [Araneus ventricosus]
GGRGGGGYGGRRRGGYDDDDDGGRVSYLQRNHRPGPSNYTDLSPDLSGN